MDQRLCIITVVFGYYSAAGSQSSGFSSVSEATEQFHQPRVLTHVRIDLSVELVSFTLTNCHVINKQRTRTCFLH